MIQEKSIIEKAAVITMPFLAFLIAIFANFVQFGFKKPDTNWYWQIVINIILMLCFWLPGKSFAVQKAIKSDMITTLKENYVKQVQKYYDNQESKKLREYLKAKHKKEVEEYIKYRLDEAEITETVFVEKYKNNNKAIRKAVKGAYAKAEEQCLITVKSDIKQNRHRSRICELTAKQGQLLKSANKFGKIKPVTFEDIMPNIIKQSIFKKNFNTYKTSSAIRSARKIFNVALIGVAISMIFVNPTQSDNVMAIVTIIFLKLLSSIISLVSGILTGRNLILDKYSQDLASKTDELDEFHASEFCKSDSEHIKY